MPIVYTLYTPALVALGYTIADAARRWRAAWQRRRRVLRAYRILAQLDDATLRDLGLSRSELSSVARLPEDRDRVPRAGTR